MSISAVGSYAMENIEAMQSRMFSKAEVNKDGGIDQAEFETGFSKMQDTLDISQEALEMFSSLDADGDGSLNMREMGQAKPPGMENGIYSPQTMRQGGMQKLDVNSDGVLDRDEVSTMASDVSEHTGESVSVDDIMSQFDANGDGVLDSSEQPPPSTTTATRRDDGNGGVFGGG